VEPRPPGQEPVLGVLDRLAGLVERPPPHEHERLADVAARADEVRENLRAIEKVRGADDLRKKLLASLAQVTADADATARAMAADNEALAETRHRLTDSLRELDL